jgi:hypothetical protein
MRPPPPTWSASPSMGAVLARLTELYARALRVDAERRAQRMVKFAQLAQKQGDK